MTRPDRKKIGTSALVLGIVLGSSCATTVHGQYGDEITNGMNSAAMPARSVLRSSTPQVAQVSQQTGSQNVLQNADTATLPAETPSEPPRYGLPGGKSGQLDAPSPYLGLPGFQSQFPFIDFSHGDANDPGRHIGMGEPLEGTSWLNRPWNFGWFVGGLGGTPLIDQHVDQHIGLFGGYRLGYDLDHYWGAEGRVAFANLPITDAASTLPYGSSNDWFWDANLLYYPWGDAKWRPYITAGLGWGAFRFTDDLGNAIKDTAFQIPVGIGLKYYFRTWIALRVDVQDNIAFSSYHTDTMNNVSMTFGAEVRVGGRRRGYFPWNPGNSP